MGLDAHVNHVNQFIDRLIACCMAFRLFDESIENSARETQPFPATIFLVSSSLIIILFRCSARYLLKLGSYCWRPDVSMFALWDCQRGKNETYKHTRYNDTRYLTQTSKLSCAAPPCPQAQEAHRRTKHNLI